MKKLNFRSPVYIEKAWTTIEVEKAIDNLLKKFKLPSRKSKILLKPNLNNDLNALMGNSTDLRIIAAVIKNLQKRGYKDITIAEGPNCGINHMKIDVFKRLKIPQLAKHFGVRLINNNDYSNKKIQLATKKADASSALFEYDFIINLPKIKTHIEAVLTLSLKNMMGCLQGLDKRAMHYKLHENIVRLNEEIRTDIVIMDGLVVMEGNGPGDGMAKKLGIILACDNPFILDLAVSELVGFNYKKINYLKHAIKRNHLNKKDLNDTKKIKPITYLIPAKQNIFAKILLNNIFVLPRYWKSLDPFFSKGFLPWLLFKLKVKQDIYESEDDDIKKIYGKSSSLKYCPLNLKSPSDSKCIKCLYCYLLDRENKIKVEGSLGFLETQLKRFGKYIKKL